ncbi:Uncharacterised protein [Acinetobacter baumannii]|nr:Uncharacterised protein [Acinetobacter baumannii]
MQHAGLRQRRLAQQRQRVGARLAGVHDHWLGGDPRGFQVQAKRLLLQLGGFRFVVVVEAGLADRHHPRMRQFAQQPVQRWRASGLQVQRVHAHRTVHVGIALGQGLHRLGIVGADADAEELTDATRSRGIQRRIERAAMGGQVEAIEVAVGIDQHDPV